jgi:DNA-binding winged helix-turn-helix (wHTH) protein/Flp pilus assembly protein TadD
VSSVYVFGSFQLDPSTRRLTRSGEVVALSPRQFDLLHLLVAHAGQVLSKDALIEAAWAGVAVTDNSLEQAVSGLRRTLGAREETPYIETQARRGYRFAAAVQKAERREPIEALDVLLAPHRAWIEGRAALETLERSQIVHARDVFERVLTQVPDQASAHVGLANAGVMQFEMTRSERSPDTAALAMAAEHAREACRLDSGYGEAWATLGFVLDRTGHRADALAASRRAVSLEPDNWRHRIRLAYVSWGEERLREARRTLDLLPGFPIAHWLAATVHVARGALDAAERELTNGIAAERSATQRFSGVALHWLAGLLMLARGDTGSALDHFERELANEAGGQLYARECCANTWYAIGAVRLRQGDRVRAGAAFEETLTRLPRHPMAHVALQAALDSRGSTPPAPALPPDHPGSPEVALAQSIAASLRGELDNAVRLVDEALASAPEGSALWLLPVEPMLRIDSGDPRWAPPLARLRNRAA